MRYALIKNNTVQNVIEAQPDFIAVYEHEYDAVVQSDDAAKGWTWNGGTSFTAPEQPAPGPAPVVPQNATKRAFQNRFPKMSNGISTKYDAMCMFLTDDGYAASLGVTGAPLFDLRMLITTGVQRMNASPFVDMAPTAEAASLTMLLMQGTIPSAFRLSTAERDTMLNTPLADAERYVG